MNAAVHVEKGFLESFKCTYHGWTYNTQGILTDLQDAEDFDDGSPCGKIKLKDGLKNTYDWISSETSKTGSNLNRFTKSY